MSERKLMSKWAICNCIAAYAVFLGLASCGNDDSKATHNDQTGSSSGGTTGGSPDGSTGGVPAGFSAFFPPGSIWSTDISTAPLDPESAQTIAWMQSNGNWGAGQLSWWPYDYLRISDDWRINYTVASTPMVPFHEASGYYLPDCDALPQFPLPAGGAIQSETGYTTCETDTGGDCHLVVFDSINQRLYESYQTDYASNSITSLCGIMWDTSKVYPPDGRGDQCTSTDAAGLPAGALVFSADDLAAGHIDHALRLTLPDSRIRQWVFVHPATHGTGNAYGVSGSSAGASAPSPAPIYGARFRLQQSFDVTQYSAGVKVILNALKKYG